MGKDLLALQALMDDIEAFAKQQLENSDISGPRFGAYVKLAWCTGSGEPCFSSCQSVLDALKILRDLDDVDEVNEFYVSMTARMLEGFPEGGEQLFDMDNIRKMGASLAKVA